MSQFLSVCFLAVVGLSSAASVASEKTFAETCSAELDRTYIAPKFATAHKICLLRGVPYQFDINDFAEISRACELEKTGNYARFSADVDPKSARPVMTVTCWSPAEAK